MKSSMYENTAEQMLVLDTKLSEELCEAFDLKNQAVKALEKSFEKLSRQQLYLERRALLSASRKRK